MSTPETIYLIPGEYEEGLVWFYTPSMNHGKRSAKGRFGKPAARRLRVRLSARLVI